MNQQHDDKEKNASLSDDQYSPLPTEKNDERNITTLVSFPKRYILLLMIFIGFVNIYAMRVNLNVALVAMVNNQTIIRRGVKMTKVKTLFYFTYTVLVGVGLKCQSHVSIAQEGNFSKHFVSVASI